MPRETAQIVWVDPGETTGLTLIGIDSGWLEGRGTPDWHGIRKAVRHSHQEQIGFDAKLWTGETAAPVNMEMQGLTSIVDDCLKSGSSGAPFTPVLRNELIVCDNIAALLNDWPLAVWGIESFKARMGSLSAEAISPDRIRLALCFAEVVYGNRHRVPFFQSAAIAKTTVDDARLRDAGLYRAGMPHANDATKHALTFARRARADAKLRAAAWPHLFTLASTAKAV